MTDDGASPRPTQEAIRVGGLVDRTSLTLGIHGDDLDPAEISVLFGCPPSHSHRRGDLRPRGRSQWRSGAWLLSVDAISPTSPSDLLETLLAKVPAAPSFWKRLRERFAVHLGFGLFLDADNRGFDLPAATLTRLATLGFDLYFDIYGAGREAQDGSAAG